MSRKYKTRRRIHLVYTPHFDPSWFGRWEDGISAAIATFKAAADFCHRHRSFVFNHDGSLLYRCLEKFEPELFERVRRLVKVGRWRITGGAYIQPDINATSGECHIRHYLLARRFFITKFDVYPTTAFNFDSAGQAEGLVQILRGCGLKHYSFRKPGMDSRELPRGTFVWRDRSGRSIFARRCDEFLDPSSPTTGHLQNALTHYDAEPVSMFLWGINNRGAPPSSHEYEAIHQFIAKHPEIDWLESTPDAYFSDYLQVPRDLPIVTGELQHCEPDAPPATTPIKRCLRSVENHMLTTERLAALTWWWNLHPYPAQALNTAWKDILFAQFHDIHPDTSSPIIENDALQILSHADEIIRRQQLRVLLAAIRQSPKPPASREPLFVFNPHGFRVRTQIEMHLNLPDHTPQGLSHEISLTRNSKPVRFQTLTPSVPLPASRRVRLAAELDLKPWEIARIDASHHLAKLRTRTRQPRTQPIHLAFKNRFFQLKISTQSGLITSWTHPDSRKSVLTPNAMALIAFPSSEFATPPTRDNDMSDTGTRFRLATHAEATCLYAANHSSTRTGPCPGAPIRIVSNGELRTVVEVLFKCEDSTVLRQYILRHDEGVLELRDCLFWNHRNSILKLHLPLTFKPRQAISEAAYSATTRAPSPKHNDSINQRWLAVVGSTTRSREVCIEASSTGCFSHALTRNGNLYLTLLRNPARPTHFYDPHTHSHADGTFPGSDRGPLTLTLAFKLAGSFNETRIRQFADLLSMPPICQVYHTQQHEQKPTDCITFANTVTVSDQRIHIVALKKAENDIDLIIRLLNTSHQSVRFNLAIRPYRGTVSLHAGRYALITVAVRKGARRLTVNRVNLVEENGLDPCEL